MRAGLDAESGPLKRHRRIYVCSLPLILRHLNAHRQPPLVLLRRDGDPARQNELLAEQAVGRVAALYLPLSSLLKNSTWLRHRMDAMPKPTMNSSVLRAVLRTWRVLKNATRAFFNGLLGYCACSRTGLGCWDLLVTAEPPSDLPSSSSTPRRSPVVTGAVRADWSRAGRCRARGHRRHQSQPFGLGDHPRTRRQSPPPSCAAS
jgi:hypothetical protein